MRQPVANFQTHTNCTKRTRELDDRGVVHFHDRRLKRSKYYSNTKPTKLKFKYLFKYFSHHYTFGSMTPLSKKKQTLDVYFFLTVDRENVQTPLSSSSRVVFVQFVCVWKLATGCLMMEFLRSGLDQNLRVELFNFCFQSLRHYRLFVCCS